jgi:hypothetical protein
MGNLLVVELRISLHNVDVWPILQQAINPAIPTQINIIPLVLWEQNVDGLGPDSSASIAGYFDFEGPFSYLFSITDVGELGITILTPRLCKYLIYEPECQFQGHNGRFKISVSRLLDTMLEKRIFRHRLQHVEVWVMQRTANHCNTDILLIEAVKGTIFHGIGNLLSIWKDAMLNYSAATVQYAEVILRPNNFPVYNLTHLLNQRYRLEQCPFWAN